MKKLYEAEWRVSNYTTYGSFRTASFQDEKRTLSAILRGSTFRGNIGCGSIYVLRDDRKKGACLLTCHYTGGNRRVDGWREPF